MLLSDVRKALRQAADPGKAAAMRAYMKSAMPYHGVPAPRVRLICRELLRLWHDARFREERYAAMHLAAHRRAQPFQVPAALRLYEEMIVTGAWWDYVDEIASHRIGPILREHPASVRRRMLAWSRSRDLWKRRAAILCQLGSREHTDVTLLYACIEPSLDSPQFFLRKAIGWALRQYARTDPGAVRRYVRAHRDRLSALSSREALKRIGPAA
jgi:3-methyladenine DNA glycosylase AlkD